jgi:hypothetical protein
MLAVLCFLLAIVFQKQAKATCTVDPVCNADCINAYEYCQHVPKKTIYRGPYVVVICDGPTVPVNLGVCDAQFCETCDGDPLPTTR